MYQHQLHRLLWAALIGLWAGTVVAPAEAQISDEQRRRLENQLRNAEENYVLRANPSLSIGERMILDYGALVNFGFLAVDDDSQSTKILRQYDNRLYGRLSIDGVHEFYGRLRFLYQDFNDGDSFRTGGGDRFGYPLGDRWWYKFDLRRAVEAYEGRYSDWNITAKVGRQYVEWATGLTLSDQLYAVNATAELANVFEVQGLFGMTPKSSVIDLDSSRPGYDTDTDRKFFGGKLTYLGLQDHKPFVYALIQRDFNDDDFGVITVGGTAFPTRFNYDSEYFAIGSTGKLMPRLGYEVEAVYQTGETNSNSFVFVGGVPTPIGLVLGDQTRDDIEAWAVRSQFTYYFFDDAKSQIELETVFASGDDDRALDTSNTFGGNTPNTHDKSFNAFGYANTGLAFAAPVSNLAMVRVGGSTFPLRESDLFRQLQVGMDFFVYNKLDSDAPIDEATSDNHYLGVEADVYANWRVTSDLGVFLRYGVYFPGTAVSADNDERHYVYMGVAYAF